MGSQVAFLGLPTEVLFPSPRAESKSTYSSGSLIISVITCWGSQRKLRRGNGLLPFPEPVHPTPGLHPVVNYYSWILPISVQQHLVPECSCFLSPRRCHFLLSDGAVSSFTTSLSSLIDDERVRHLKLFQLFFFFKKGYLYLTDKGRHTELLPQKTAIFIKMEVLFFPALYILGRILEVSN